MFETYAILDPRRPGKYTYKTISFMFRPFYIGKGSIHQNRIYKRKNKQVEGVIRKIKENNLLPIYVSLEQFKDERGSLNKEVILIAEIGRKDLRRGPLLNFTNGGEGVTGIKLTKKAIEQRRVRMKAFWDNMTPIQRKKIGRLSLLNRRPERVKAGCMQASLTKSQKPVEVKKDIERRRYKKWCKKMYNLPETKKKTRSKKCSIAANKKRVVFLQLEILDSNNPDLKINNVYTKNIKEWQKLNIPRDVATTMWKANNINKICKTRQGIVYRVKSGFLADRDAFFPSISLTV
jgi:hypothetical protein